MKFLSNILLKAGLVVEGTTDLQGTATAVTQTLSDSSTKLATTAFVKGQGYILSNIYSADGSLTGNRTITLDGNFLDISGATKTRFFANGNVVIDGANPVDAGFKLDVGGTARISNILTVGSNVATAAVIKGPSSDGSLVYAGSSFSNSSIPVRTIIINTVGTYSGLTGGSNLFVGRNAGSNVTSGTSNVFIGKSAGAGITTGGSNVILSSSDATNLPSSLANSLHLVAGNGYRANDASSIPSATHAFIGGGFSTGIAIKDFYFGQMPFTADAGSGFINIAFYAPSGLGTDIGGANFTIAAGRGTGAGTPGDFIIRTSNTTTTGSTLQTLADRIRVAGGTGIVTIANLSGTGTRMVVADSSGVLSTQAISSGITGSLTSGYVPKATGASSLADGLIYDTGSAVLIGTQNAGSGKFMVYSTSPDNHYQAVGSAPSFRFADTITSPNYTGIFGLATASNHFIIGAAAGDMVLSNNTTSAIGNFLFGTGATERMRISPAGNVSINNTNNTYRFDVNGTVRFTGQFRLESTITDGTYTYTLPSATGTLALTSDIPSLSGYVPTSRTITINGVSYDLSADRSWSVTSMVYPPAGIAVSTGSSWGTSITDNSSNWNTAYSWGNHATAGYLTASSASVTYLTISNASSTYLTQSSANTIYLNKTDASSIYLSQSSANTIYLNKNDASSTYLSQSSAALLYVSLSGSYSNPSWVTSLAWSKITGAPAFITGIDSSMITSALGYTPVTNARTITINGVTYDLSADRSWTIAGGLSGSGTTNYLPKFTGASSIGNSLLQEGTNAIGLGVTPSAWGSPFSVLQLGTYGQYVAGQTNTGDMKIGTNHYYNAGTFYYTLSGLVTARYDIGKDGFSWNIAPAGIANAGISFTQAMTLNASGNLSIGNTNDTYKLDVSGTGRFSNILYVSRPAMTTQSDYGYQNIIVTTGFGGGYTGAKIQSLIAGFDSSIYGVDIGYSYQSGLGYNLHFSTNDDLTGNPIERLKISTTGAATFSSSVTATQLYLPSNAGSSGFLQFNYSSANANSRSWRIYNDTYAYGDLSIAQSTTQTGSSYNYLLTINPQGNVGIGTTSPSTILHLATTTESNIRIESGGAGGDQGSIYVQKSTGGGLTFAVENRDFIWRTGAAALTGGGGSERMRINSGGYVGIATSSPSRELDVNGNIRVRSGAIDLSNDFNNQVYSLSNAMYLKVNGTERLTIASTGAATFSSTVSTQGSISINNGGGLFATGDVLTTGGRLLVSNGNQTANAESGSILLGNRGYFTTSDIGAARISAVSTGANWYNGTAIAFYTNPGPDVTSTGATERMRITSGGQLLVGTTSALQSTERLAVTSSTNTAIMAQFTGGATNGWAGKFWNNDTSGNNLLVEYLTESSITARGSIRYDRSGNRLNIVGEGSGLLFTGTSTFGSSISTPKIFINTSTDYGNLNIIGYDNSGINIIDQRTSTSGLFYSAITFRDYYLAANGAINFYHNQYFGGGVNRLGFAVNGTDHLTILHNGNVGIGTTSPAVKLEVNGEIRLPNNTFLQAKDTSTGWIEMVKGDSSNNTVIANNKGASIVFSNDVSTERMRITSGGSVGIGTSSPAERLTVAGNFRVNGANANSRLIIYQDYSNSAVGVQLFNTSGVSVIDLNGNAGNINITGSVTGAKGFFSSNAATDSTTALLANASTNDSTSYAAVFGSLNAGYRMVVRGDGRVGIGTTNPSGLLHVRGATGLTNFGTNVIQVESTSDNFSGIVFSGTSGSNAAIRSEGTSAMSFWTASGTTYTERMRMNSFGEVLINATATTQSARFYVNGKGAFGSLYIGNLSTGTVYSNMGNLTNTNPSDIRLKNTIKPLTYGLNEVLQLNPKTFYYNDDATRARLKYGFIAQEVKEVMPDMVRLLGNEDYLGLESEGIWVTLVNAIKEQQAQINELKSQLNK